MPEGLRPLSLGEVLDRTAQIYRGRFLTFLAIAALPTGILVLVVALATAFFAWAARQPSGAGQAAQVVAIAAALMLILVGIPLYLGALALGWAAITHGSARAFFGEKVTIREAYRAAWKHGWRYVGLALLLALFAGVIPLGLVFAGIVPFSLLSLMGPAATAFGGFILFVLVVAAVVAMVWVALMLCLAFPASVFEGLSPWKSLVRSKSLSQGSRGRILVLFLLGWVLSTGMAFVLTMVMIILVALIPALQKPANSDALGAVVLVITYCLSFVAQALVRPLYGIALTVFYFDQRIRKEGFDIEWMMQQAGLTPPPAPAVEAAPWLPPVAPQPETASANSAPPTATEEAP